MHVGMSDVIEKKNDITTSSVVMITRTMREDVRSNENKQKDEC